MYFTSGRIPYSLLTAVDVLNVAGGAEVSMASDAFFPFRDNIDCASQVNVKAISQPGGSTRDQEVIDACNDYGIAMVSHNKRMFTH
jgi:phosphoribosylaminoimidazolecarboxamide formyltransferase/IMP cyclohydrolase